jgi:hypothetical protein
MAAAVGHVEERLVGGEAEAVGKQEARVDDGVGSRGGDEVSQVDRLFQQVASEIVSLSSQRAAKAARRVSKVPMTTRLTGSPPFVPAALVVAGGRASSRRTSSAGAQGTTLAGGTSVSKSRWR